MSSRSWSPGALASTVLASARRLLPVCCVVCSRAIPEHASPICTLCRTRMPRLTRPRCARCGEPLGRAAPAGAPDGRCGTCEDWPASLETAASAFEYAQAVPDVVHALKYGRWRSLAPWMGRVMAPEARSILGLGGWPVRTALVPVPLSSARLRERGFNQALDLALPLGGQTGLPVLPVLRRRAGGGRQAGAGRTFRRENVEGRFAACPVDRTEAAILVDDVLTTGATAFACADALAQAGFTRIAVITFARTSRAIDARASQRGRRIGRLRVVGRSSSRAGPPARERGGASARAFLESSTGDAMSEASR